MASERNTISDDQLLLELKRCFARRSGDDALVLLRTHTAWPVNDQRWADLAREAATSGVIDVAILMQTQMPAGSRGDLLLWAAERDAEQLSMAMLAFAAALVDAGADVNLRNGDEQTVLMLLCGALDGYADRPYRLSQGCNERCLDVVTKALTAGADVNAVDRRGMSALSYAATHRDPLVVSLLVKHGANANQRDAQGGSALIAAAGRPDDEALSVVNVLVQQCADVDAVMNCGATALSVTSRQDVWNFILSHTQHTRLGLSLHALAHDGKLERLEELLKRGAAIEQKNSQGDTPLHVAVAQLQLEAVRLLLQRGANPNAANNEGWTPLFAVVRTASRGAKPSAALTMLLEAGATPNCIDGHGTPLLHQVVMSYPELFDQIARHGADLTLCRSDGSSLLMTAANCSNRPLVLRLLSGKMAVDQSDQYSRTPLLVAAGRCDAPLVADLLAAGANVHTRDTARMTALHYATSQSPPWPKTSTDSAQTVRVLLAGSAEVDAADVNQNTALFYAVRARDVETARVLLESGANPKHADARGVSILQHAEKAGGDIAHLLRQAVKE